MFAMAPPRVSQSETNPILRQRQDHLFDIQIKALRGGHLYEQTVKRFQKVGEELRHRNAGWWDRIVKTIPELAALSNTPQTISTIFFNHLAS